MSPNAFPILHIRQDGTPSNATISATPSPTPSTTTSPSPSPSAAPSSGGGLAGWGIFLIVVLAIAAVVLIIGCVVQRFRMRREGFGAQGNSFDQAKGWFENATYKLRNPRARSASAGFEGISAGPRSANRGAGAFDQDEAWDSRVGTEYHGSAYADETELQPHGHYRGFQDQSTGYTGHSGQERGRVPPENPFTDDHAAPSLRSLSPRPHDGSHLDAQRPGSSRRSLFKEEV